MLLRRTSLASRQPEDRIACSASARLSLGLRPGAREAAALHSASSLPGSDPSSAAAWAPRASRVRAPGSAATGWGRRGRGGLGGTELLGLGHQLVCDVNALAERGCPPPPHRELLERQFRPLEDDQFGLARVPLAFFELEDFLAHPRIQDGPQLGAGEIEAVQVVVGLAKLDVVHAHRLSCPAWGRAQAAPGSLARMMATASGLESIST